MRSPSRKVLIVIAAALGAAIAASIASGAVVGERLTWIISPPQSNPADKSKEAAGPSDTTLYSDDGARSGSATPTTDPIVETPRPADNLEFSQDNRKVRNAAYDSLASNLVSSPDSGGHRQVYLFKRAINGSTSQELVGGSLEMASVTAKGKQAGNGDSIKPSLDGQTHGGNGASTPHCVVFQSKATNLDKADKSADWDIYLHHIQSGKTELVSVGAPADARDGVVDGQCQTITYESGGSVYVRWLTKRATFKIARGFNPDQETDGKGVAYDRDGQVYYTEFFQKSVKDAKGKHHQQLIAGTEELVSDNARGEPGNGPSMMPSANDNGAYIAFESHATDLCDGTKARCGTTDKNGAKSDVYRRTMPGKTPKGHRKRKAPTSDEMEMISYDGTIDFQSDLDSDQVKISGAGEQACFRSFGALTHDKKFAVDGHSGPFMHVYFWNFPRERMLGKFTGESKAGRTSDTEFTREDGTAAFNWSCAISNRGNFIGWSSDVEDKSGETNGRQVADTFIRFMGASDEGLGGDLGQ